MQGTIDDDVAAVGVERSVGEGLVTADGQRAVRCVHSVQRCRAVGDLNEAGAGQRGHVKATARGEIIESDIAVVRNGSVHYGIRHTQDAAECAVGDIADGTVLAEQGTGAGVGDAFEQADDGDAGTGVGIDGARAGDITLQEQVATTECMQGTIDDDVATEGVISRTDEGLVTADGQGTVVGVDGIQVSCAGDEAGTGQCRRVETAA